MSFVLYLTGAPGTGKSSVGRAMAEREGVELLSYGALLTERLAAVSGQEELRRRSSEVISAQAVTDLDQLVAERIVAASARGDVVVDSHAVTVERYGFRVVPYSAERFASIPYTHIACLYAPASVVRTRLRGRAEGRPVLDDAAHERLTSLQESIALSYAHSSGLPAAFIDASRSLDTVIDTVLSFVGVSHA